jgi:hypothetical protein
MDLKIDAHLFEKRIDPQSGNILFYRKDMKGIPDQVVEGDGFTVEFKDGQVYLIDIFNAEKVLGKLIKDIEVECFSG